MSLTSDQIAITVDFLCPGAAYSRCDTYEILVATWTDTTYTCPTEAELEAAWAIVDKNQQLNTLNSEYRTKMVKLKQDYAAAPLGNTDPTVISTRQSEIIAEYAELKTALLAAQEVILNG